ncbi:MAG: Rubrerythrin [Anaerolineae bacterium]|nr:Rubrerythrin [Anaerolineae bacterium]
MPEFINPFSGTIPERKLSLQELLRAIRLNIAAEHEAIHLYMAHAEATDHPLAKKVLIDIANEEREHIGEFMQLLQILTGDEAEWLENGQREVSEMAVQIGSPTDEQVTPSEETPSPNPPVIGSLKT